MSNALSECLVELERQLQVGQQLSLVVMMVKDKDGKVSSVSSLISGEVDQNAGAITWGSASEDVGAVKLSIIRCVLDAVCREEGETSQPG